MPARMTIEDLRNKPCARLNPHLFEKVEEKKKKSKFSNEITEVYGIKFRSAKEANRYRDLKLLLKAGKIDLLELQVPYELNEGGTHSYKYVADFKYWDCDKDRMVVEDTKGWRTKEYKKKKKLMKKLYGIEILET